jgi:aminoglycoside/choline kinase family phosphotransferase
MPARLPDALAAERVQWLPAEASARRYARLHRPRHQPHPTVVAMVFHPATRTQEVERVARATRLLADAGLPVPEVLDMDSDGRWILQEDLGDVTLAEARSAGHQVATAYSEAVGLLSVLPGLSLDTSPKPPLDARRLRDELQQFARLALRLGDGPGAGLAAELDALVTRCMEAPQVLCHRDYHARNLMLKEGRVRVIDHQDALLGPAPYDRVSLAYDPYVELADPIRDRIAGEGEAVAAVALQRLAKAMGTFADKGGKWTECLVPSARQARRQLGRSELALPLLDLGLAAVAAGQTSGRAAS